MSFAKRARDNFFTLNGRSSADWGIVASKDNGFDAPERDVSAIEVPGRNGELHIDNGRWRNIDVTYNDCVIEHDFTERFGDFRAYCARLRGYQRLEDTFHPNEYRLADMTEGIKVKQLGTRYNNGRFDLTFNCKPQRFLKSGEEPIMIIPPVGAMSSTSYFTYPTTWPGHITPANRWTVAVTIIDSPVPLSVYVRYFCVDAGEEFTSDSETYTPAIGERIEIPLDNANNVAKKWKIMVDSGSGRTTEEIDSMRIRVEGYAEVGDEEFMYIDGICARSLLIENPTGFECKPMFVFYGAIAGLRNVVKSNGEGWSIVNWDYSGVANKMIMDCENEYVYSEINGVKTNLTQYMEISHFDKDSNALPLSFPNFGEGENQLYQYFVSNLDNTFYILYPHWYTI